VPGEVDNPTVTGMDAAAAPPAGTETDVGEAKSLIELPAGVIAPSLMETVSKKPPTLVTVRADCPSEPGCNVAPFWSTGVLAAATKSGFGVPYTALAVEMATGEPAEAMTEFIGDTIAPIGGTAKGPPFTAW